MGEKGFSCIYSYTETNNEAYVITFLNANHDLTTLSGKSNWVEQNTTEKTLARSTHQKEN